MSQSAVTEAGTANESSELKDTTRVSSVSTRSKTQRRHPELEHVAELNTSANTSATNENSKIVNTATDNAQAVGTTPARMTRKRIAELAQPDTLSAHKDEDTPPPSATAEFVGQICLCQPDPKIPRPRNAFILYRQHSHQSLVNKHPGLSNPEISKLAGQLWQAESDEVKIEWKLLAEEEKARHAQLYPQYRFQPRHKNKASPIAGLGEKSACAKCGGVNLTARASPFASPLHTDNSQHIFTASVPNSAVSPSPQSLPKKATKKPLLQTTMINPSGQQQYYGDHRYVVAGSPLTRRFPDSAVETSDSKRRRVELAPTPHTARPDVPRVTFAQGQAGTSAHSVHPPTPHVIDHRRASISQAPDGSFYLNRSSIGHVNSPAPLTPHPNVPVTGPPPSRVSSISARGSAHGIQATPTSGPYHHVGNQNNTPLSARPRSGSESLRLAPLISPSDGDQGSSLGAMIMGIPVFGKAYSLRKVAQPIKEPAPTSPSYRVRGSIIAIEGDDKASAEAMMQQLERFLRRDDNFDVRVFSGPELPGPEPRYEDILLVASKFHSESRRIKDFVTGVEYQRAEDAKAKNSPVPSSSEATLSKAKVDLTSEMDTDTEEGEVLDEEHQAAQSARRKTRAEELDRKKAEMAASIERESRRASAAQEHAGKIPIVLICNYILHASNAWASVLPIGSVYSPADHYTWTATMWRGVVGADLTIYVRDAEREREEQTMSAGPGPSPVAEKKVEMKEEIGMMLVRKEGEKVDDGALRRVAFEVGEWVRLQSTMGKCLVEGK